MNDLDDLDDMDFGARKQPSTKKKVTAQPLPPYVPRKENVSAALPPPAPIVVPDMKKKEEIVNDKFMDDGLLDDIAPNAGKAL